MSSKDLDRAIHKEFQEIKWMTLERFVERVNYYISAGYATAEEHYHSAMSCHKRIYKPMIADVVRKVEEFREVMDGVHIVKKLQDAPELRTAEQIINNMTVTEHQLYTAQSGDIITIMDRKFRIEPLD